MPQATSHAEKPIETMSIQIPSALADQIRSRVLSGEFESASEVIVRVLQDAEEWNVAPDGPFESVEEWEQELRETIARLDRGEERTYTLDEVRAHLASRRLESIEG